MTNEISQKAAAIDAALRRIDGIDKFMRRGEIKELPAVLWENELPEMLVAGMYNGGFGILVATDRRLIFLDKGLMSFKMDDFPYEGVSSIETKTGLLSGQITIYTSGNKEEIKHVTKSLTRHFADFVSTKIAHGRAVGSGPVESSGVTLSIADELQKLATLRDAGVLTESEFESQKSRLLGM